MRRGTLWMMKTKTYSLPLWSSIAASLVLLPALTAPAQTAPAPASPAQPPAQPAPMASTIAAAPADRASAYYHVALANIDEEDAVSQGRPELITRAIEEYKLALNADPNSPQLNDGLADLYFRMPGHEHDAEVTAKQLLKTSPDDIDAHKLLGRIYLRRLS